MSDNLIFGEEGDVVFHLVDIAPKGIDAVRRATPSSVWEEYVAVWSARNMRRLQEVGKRGLTTV